MSENNAFNLLKRIFVKMGGRKIFRCFPSVLFNFILNVNWGRIVNWIKKQMIDCFTGFARSLTTIDAVGVRCNNFWTSFFPNICFLSAQLGTWKEVTPLATCVFWRLLANWKCPMSDGSEFDFFSHQIVKKCPRMQLKRKISQIRYTNGTSFFFKK